MSKKAPARKPYQQQLKAVRAENADLKQQLAKLTKSTEKLRKEGRFESAEPPSAMMANIQSLAAHIEDLEKELEQSKTPEKKLSQTRRKHYEDLISGVEEQLAQMAAETSELKEQLTQMAAEISELEELNDTLNDDRLKLTDKNDELKREFEGAVAEKDELKREFEDAAAEVKRLEVKLAGRDSRRRNDGAELKKMEKELNKVKEKNEKILATYDEKVELAEDIARRKHAAAVTACEKEIIELKATIQEMGTLGDKARAVFLGSDSSSSSSASSGAPAIPLPAGNTASRKTKKKKKTRRRRRGR